MIGDRIYKLRKRNGLSQEEFANSIGVTRQIVSKWESNQSIPGVDKLKKISDVYNILYDELLQDTNYEIKKKVNVVKYLIMFLLMIFIQVIFIFVITYFSNNDVDEYKCVGSQSYVVMEIYDSEDNNFSYITLKKGNIIETVRVSKVIVSLIEVGKKYEFVFRSNNDNRNITYIFHNNDIVNVIESDNDIDIVSCK